MIYEFAVEPQLLADFERCKTLLDLFSFAAGRVVSGYPSRRWWWELADAKVEAAEIKTLHKEALRTELESLRDDAVVDRRDLASGNIPPDEWLQHAVALQNERQPFRAILCEQPSGTCLGLVDWAFFRLSHELIHVPVESEVERSPEAMANHFAKLLDHSSQLLIVDPYFDPQKLEYREAIKALIEQAAKGRKPLSSVEIHATKHENKSTAGGFTTCELRFFRGKVEDRRAELLPPVLDQSTTVRFVRNRYLPDDGSTDARPHERLLLTEHGGYRLDHGFEQRAGTQPVAILSRESHKTRLSRYLGREIPTDGEFEL